MLRTSKQKNAIDKREVIRIYNQINQEIYDTGISQQKIEISENSLMIFAVHKRVEALKILRDNYPELVSYANTALFTEFKAKLKENIEDLTGMNIMSILMDYDAATQHSCGIIYFDKNIQNK